jgi:long-chain fatty acid transport protein
MRHAVSDVAARVAHRIVERFHARDVAYQEDLYSMKTRLASSLALGLLLTPALAFATNGMDPISFGARAAGMGGADTAVATDSHAINTNPAGITQFQHGADIGISLLMPSLTMNDEAGGMKLNQGVKSESKVFPLISAGYAQHIWKGLHAGLGFYVQGGMGAEFQGLKTFVDDNPSVAMNPPGSQVKPATYNTSSQISYFKFTPTLAYRFKDLKPGFDLSIGAAFNIGIANMKFTHTGFQFPETDNDGAYAAHSVDFKSDSAIGYAVRGGILASFLHGNLTFGVSYQSKSSLTFKGTTTMDSMMKYNSSAAFGWPQEFAMGIAGRPISPLLLSGEIRLVNWSNTVDVVRGFQSNSCS